jgi:hypothetical protein
MQQGCLRPAITQAPFWVLALFAAGANGFAQPAPDAPAFDALMARIAESAMRYQGRLPDFSCTEVTVRMEENKSKSGTNWRTLDTLEEAVSFASTGRISKTLVKKNGRPTTSNKAGGLTENGVLSDAIVPRGIFGAKAQAKFAWDHWETRADHRIAVIAYQAAGENYPDGKTLYELKVTGRIDFDDTAGDLIRTELSSVGPPGYPFAEVRVETDYGPVRISDRELILPRGAVVTAVSGQRKYKSEIQFLGYRKYQADATIRFNDGH